MTAARLLGLDVGLIGRRGTAVGILAVFAGSSLLVALGFAARAGEIVLSRHFDPEIAALIVAASALVVVLVAALAMTLVLRRTRREVKRAVAASTMVTLAPPALSFALKHKEVAAVALAAGLGFWLTRRRD